ncbi:hypothetical protein KSP40_PGU012040 [Platanthera guangdongensis]|uniref:Clp R domain-containing protein n=1 Tax=Platanthera guangdongensis TaxID=2320717 RepID=A0ABR2LZ81_9ASPA
MRAGACTIQQALTTEAAAILKHSLNLARRRGHAQVTPLHVAATLLNSSCSASSLLRRACVRSHPHHPTSLPLQCRALELCFNVALNRLPTSSPPSSSSSLLRSHPSLSNALIAALKRAQAHQRRGCIEIQNNISHQSQQQSNQPLLAIKVELEQLIISILDDPSVSRVMREAGFSSTSVKHNLEEDSSTAGFGISPCAKPLSFFDNGSLLFPTQFMKQVEKKEGDVRVVLEVMMRRDQQSPQQRKRSGNTVVVGDSASMAEGVVDELLMRLERGDVPEELRGAQVIKLQLSYVHLRLMSRIDVEMKISDLRRRIFSSLEKGVVVYAGDLRWIVGEEDRDDVASAGFKPADYFISEFGRFLSELKSGINGGGRGRIQVLAFSSYQTYMRCKLMNPSLESQWALQAVVVPSGGLALSLHSPCGRDSVTPKLKQYHEFQRPKQNRVCDGDEVEEKLTCCGECISHYEKEAASALKFVTKEAITVNSQLPCWLQNTKPEKVCRENLFELRRKWNRLCRNLHDQSRISQVRAQIHPTSISNAYPWWSNSLPPSTKRNISMESSSISPKSLPKSPRNTIATTLALCSRPVFADSAASTDKKMELLQVSQRDDLTKKLQENIPWQSETMRLLVVDALMECRSNQKKGNWILIHGNDLIAKRRLARVVAESLGSTLGVLHIDVRKSSSGSIDLLAEALEKGSKNVVLIEGIESGNPELIKQIKDGIKTGFLMNSCGREVCLASLLIILTSSASEMEEDSDRVIRMRIRAEEEHPSFSDEKRKAEWNPTGAKKKKKLGTADGGALDLNVAIIGNGEGEEEGALSGLTHEVGAGCEEDHDLPPTAVFNFETNAANTADQIAEGFTAKLRRVFEEMVAGNGGEGRLVVEQDLAEKLAAASGFFLEVEFDRWVNEVFKICIPTVKRGGRVRLEMEGKEGNLEGLGYLGSPLPKKIIVS